MIYPLEKIKDDIQKQLKELLIEHNIEIRLEAAPEGMGDYAFPCFSLAPILKKSPNDIAIDISKKIVKGKYIESIEAKSGYVNFHVNNSYLFPETLDLILKNDNKYGHLKNKEKKVIIEHTSANPNGPLHVGRARNPIIGDTLVRIFKAAGYNVESQFYLDDMGKQVAILAWGINNLDQKDIPKSEINKEDHKKVGYYQLANKLMKEKNEIESGISEIIKNSEQGDKKTLEMIHKAYNPVLKGMNESLKKINIEIDRYVAESQFVLDKSVDDVIENLKKTKYCDKEDDAFYLDLESFGIHGRNTKFFFQRKDGTSLYATRDIAYHKWKSNEADILINVLGEDHKLESKQVEIALKLLNVNIIPNPIFYAFVSLPGGKMSTRRGRVVYLDELIEECTERAYSEVKKRRSSELSDKKMKEIASIVGIGALRYNIIKVQPEKDIVFKWEEALNFEGNAVPFIQYAHARACSILLKAEKVKDYDAKLLTHESEIKLIKQLTNFPLIIEEASNGFKPHLIAGYLFDTASKFNQFYRDCPVLHEKNQVLRNSRIVLVDGVRIVLRNALDLLGVVAPEEM